MAATQTALAELLARPLDDLDLVALMVDGVHFAEHCLVVALGIDGAKHPLALVEGSTENATLVTELLTGLRARGLDTTRPILVVIDGAKALRRAVTDVFDHPSSKDASNTSFETSSTGCPSGCARWSSAGCVRPTTQARRSRPKASCRRWPGSSTSPIPARRRACARGWTRRSRSCAWTCRRRWPARCVRPTTESMLEICREHAKNVKRWRDGQMALRWCAAGMVEAGKQFRKVNGFLYLPALRQALDAYIASPVTPTQYNKEDVA